MHGYTVCHLLLHVSLHVLRLCKPKRGAEVCIWAGGHVGGGMRVVRGGLEQVAVTQCTSGYFGVLAREADIRKGMT